MQLRPPAAFSFRSLLLRQEHDQLITAADQPHSPSPAGIVHRQNPPEIRVQFLERIRLKRQLQRG